MGILGLSLHQVWLPFPSGPGGVRQSFWSTDTNSNLNLDVINILLFVRLGHEYHNYEVNSLRMHKHKIMVAVRNTFDS